MSKHDLAEELGISERTIRRIYNRYRQTRSTKRKLGSGKRKFLTAPLKLRILRLVENNPSLTCKQIAIKLNNVVSVETVRLYLKSQNFSWKKRCKVQPFSQADKDRRVQLAEAKGDGESFRKLLRKFPKFRKFFCRLFEQIIKYLRCFIVISTKFFIMFNYGYLGKMVSLIAA